MVGLKLRVCRTLSTPHGRGEIVSVDQSGPQANRLAEIVGRFQLQIKGGQQRCCALVKLAQRFSSLSLTSGSSMSTACQTLLY
jgi:hypothetical protein